MDREDLERWVQRAVERLIVDHWELAPLGVGERTVTSHLAAILGDVAEIPADMRVDHEYNRHFEAVKRISRRVREEGLDPEGEQRIYPDIVVHRRGTDVDNWLVIEAKRYDGCDELDRLKVEALIEEYSYQWGALIALGMRTNGWHPSVEWIASDGGEELLAVFSDDRLAELNSAGEENWLVRAVEAGTP